MQLLNKPIEFYSTASLSEQEDVGLLVKAAYTCLLDHPVDMLVFDFTEDGVEIKSAGYFLDEKSSLDEETVLAKFEDKSYIAEKLWLKIDDYNDKFVATFLYPYEY
jgi:hypothetical protein